MRKLIRWLALVMLLAATNAGAQQYAHENDGRNWNGWGRDAKVNCIGGMMMMEHAFYDLIRVAHEYGNGDVSDNFLSLAEGLLGVEPVTVRSMVDTLDLYYKVLANQTKEIWKAYFLCRGILIWTGDKP